MSGIRIISVYPLGIESFRVQWDLEQAVTNQGPFNFTLLRSGSPAGPWEVVASDMGDVYTKEDTRSLIHGMGKDLWYKVTANSGDFDSPARNVRQELPRAKYLIWRKMVNDQELLLRKMNGVEVSVLKLRHWGERCASCRDKKTGHIVVKNCLVCYGTGFTGGYFAPIRTLCHFKPAPVGTDMRPDTSVPEIVTTNGYMLAYPLVKRGDILVERSVNIRWEVTVTQETEIFRNAVHQDITLSRLPDAHIIYKFSV